MKTNKALYRSAVRVAIGVALILSVPFVAALVADDFAWTLGDFVAAGSSWQRLAS